ncbi:hypothetical protein Pcinc_024967 [Petrolisthes cinctipes]|uniref:Uncharacterized protein n=1 Tax=Petrolisthes cinctipes TaxID=88211 RepID=A0AAE1KC84_PETCI|nr:hypothetical protein Pcinc_024967 [Petrolisthes cinctipes]
MTGFMWTTCQNGGKLQITAGITMRDGEVISDLVKSATLNRYLDTFKYKLVLTSLLETFPYLLEGLPIDDALGLWKHRLRNKFKNNRRRKRPCTAGGTGQEKKDN